MELQEPSLIVLELSTQLLDVGGSGRFRRNGISSCVDGISNEYTECWPSPHTRTVWPANIRGHVNHVKVAQVQVQIAVA